MDSTTTASSSFGGGPFFLSSGFGVAASASSLLAFSFSALPSGGPIGTFVPIIVSCSTNFAFASSAFFNSYLSASTAASSSSFFFSSAALLARAAWTPSKKGFVPGSGLSSNLTWPGYDPCLVLWIS